MACGPVTHSLPSSSFFNMWANIWFCEDTLCDISLALCKVLCRGSFWGRSCASSRRICSLIRVSSCGSYSLGTGVGLIFLEEERAACSLWPPLFQNWHICIHETSCTYPDSISLVSPSLVSWPEGLEHLSLFRRGVMLVSEQDTDVRRRASDNSSLSQDPEIHSGKVLLQYKRYYVITFKCSPTEMASCQKWAELWRHLGFGIQI